MRGDQRHWANGADIWVRCRVGTEGEADSQSLRVCPDRRDENGTSERADASIPVVSSCLSGGGPLAFECRIPCGLTHRQQPAEHTLEPRPINLDGRASQPVPVRLCPPQSRAYALCDAT